MTIFKLSSVLSALAALPLLAQGSPAPTLGARPAPVAVAHLADCAVKGCPKLDEQGQPPTSCRYTSGMATGWQCILICAYPKSNWGTKVDSSNCD